MSTLTFFFDVFNIKWGSCTEKDHCLTGCFLINNFKGTIVFIVFDLCIPFFAQDFSF